MTPDLIDERFLVTSEARVGGMSEVRRAVDIQTGRPCAIKRMLENPNDALIGESFFREYRALEDLKHPNIVEMITCGREPDGRSFIALEWVDHNLEEWIEKEGPLNWTTFWKTVGRPLLDAIRTAQAAKWIHRDIKPKNVLMTPAGVPKLSDYGIARDHSAVLSTYTFKDFNSKPYSAPDKDDGSSLGYTRDIFSWAIVAGYCMTGREPVDYGEIGSWLASCSGAPTDILARAASLSKEERPEFAAVLLLEIDEWVQATSQSLAAPRCHIRLDDSALNQIRDILGQDGGDPLVALTRDFGEVQGARVDDLGALRLYGANWLLHAKRDEHIAGLLNVSRARFLGSAEAERQRDAGYSGFIDISFGVPPESASAEIALDNLFAEAAASEQEREIRRKGDADRVFRAWHAYLSARFDFETSRSNALSYSDLRVSGRSVSITITDPIPLDLIGQDRLIRAKHGKFVALEVIGSNQDEITLSVMVGDPAGLPREGRLEINTVRAEKALERQRQALNAVMHRRCVNPGLRDLIVDPSQAVAPGSVISPKDAGPDFDGDKVAILTKALNLNDVLTVEGPPGTGKTRLIEEIILQYIERNPKHRVLLSSQTHVALDNVIDRITKRGAHLNIVRVGRLDDQRISAIASEYILEKKAHAWSQAARRGARKWLAKWALENGVDPVAVEGGMLALSLARVVSNRRVVDETLEQIAVRAAEPPDGDETQVAGPDDTVTRETVSQTYEELVQRQSSLIADEAEIRQRMRSVGGFSVELADSSDDVELREYAQLLIGSDPVHHKCRALMELQQQWLERIGRSNDFHGAMLASANIVAATCVGLAGVRGIETVAFDLCIIDEASKATATEVLVPLSRSRRAILVGDPKQLPPFFEQDLLAANAISDFREEEIRENVFDRLLERLPKPSRLALHHQYRMAKPIGDMVSDVFYAGALISPRLTPKITFPQFPRAVTWLDTSRFDDRYETRQGFGYVNRREIRIIRKTLEGIAFIAAARKKSRYTIAVIAGYVAQVRAIEASIMDIRSAWSELDIKINTVDAFQGSEADICIYSVVRSNRDDKVGFLRERPRLNVALSRGKDLLVIIGDHTFCSGLGPDLPLASVVKYGAEHTAQFEVRAADDT